MQFYLTHMDIPIEQLHVPDDFSGNVYLSFSGELRYNYAGNFISRTNNVLATVKPSHVTFLFAASGGSTRESYIVYNYIKSLSIPFSIHVVGPLILPTMLIILAAKERFASEAAYFNFEDIKYNFKDQGTSVDVHKLKKATAVLEQGMKVIGEVFARETGISEEKFREMRASE